MDVALVPFGVAITEWLWSLFQGLAAPRAVVRRKKTSYVALMLISAQDAGSAFGPP